MEIMIQICWALFLAGCRRCSCWGPVLWFHLRSLSRSWIPSCAGPTIGGASGTGPERTACSAGSRIRGLIQWTLCLYSCSWSDGKVARQCSLKTQTHTRIGFILADLPCFSPSLLSFAKFVLQHCPRSPPQQVWTYWGPVWFWWSNWTSQSINLGLV